MNNVKATTQDHLDIEDIRNNLVILKNGSVCAVLQTTAVNFDLLSEIEQDAIIAAFSMLLNSITFPVQVVLRSKRLDISKYIEKVQRIEEKLDDPLLKHQAEAYRKFIQDLIKYNKISLKKITQEYRQRFYYELFGKFKREGKMDSDTRKLLEFFQLEDNATLKDLKKRFKELLLVYHPDVNKDGHAKTQEIIENYNKLFELIR
jgi:type IV secretory pathway VirB4 component